MPPQVATLVFSIGVMGLFLLDRDRKARTSKALWVAVLWVLINGSRPVSAWVQSKTLQKMQSPDQYLDGSPLDRFVYTGLLAVGLMILAGRRVPVGNLLRRNPWVVLFFSYCALSVLWSDYTEVSFKRWIKALGDLVMVLIVLTDADPFTACKRFVARVGFVLVPASVLLIKYYPALGRVYNIWTWEPMFVGVADHKNTLGMVCMVLGLGFEWRFLLAYREPRDSHRTKCLIAFGVLIAMAVWLLLTANSMTSMSCFLLGSGFMVATSFRSVIRRPARAHLLIGGIMFVAVFAMFFDSGGSLVGAMGRDPTLTGRTDIWRLVLGMTENQLIGTGFESFWLGKRAAKMWAEYYFHPTQAHNGYIEVFLEGGWIGITMLAGLIIAGYRNAAATFRRNPDAGRIRLAYIAVGLTYNLTEAGFRMTAPTWIFFLLSAIVVRIDTVVGGLPALRANSRRNVPEWEPQSDLESAFAKETI